MNAKETAEVLLAGIGDEMGTSFHCDGCDDHVDDPDVDTLADLIEHVMFDHITRMGLDVVRRGPLLSGYELALSMDLPARTEHEEKWRAVELGLRGLPTS